MPAPLVAHGIYLEQEHLLADNSHHDDDQDRRQKRYRNACTNFSVLNLRGHDLRLRSRDENDRRQRRRWIARR